MATNSTNYGFNKPEDTDNADLGIFIADNMDLIDSELFRVEGLVGTGGGGGVDTSVRSAFLAESTTPQMMNPWWIKCEYPNEIFDNLNGYDPALSRYTVQENGVYLIMASMLLSQNQRAGNRAVLQIYLNGASRMWISDSVQGGWIEKDANGTVINYDSMSSAPKGMALMQLNAGEYIEIYMFSSNATETRVVEVAGVSGSFFSMTKLSD